MSQSGSYGNGGGGSGFVQTLTGNTGGAVGPDGLENINILGSGSITVSGNAGDNTLTISSSGSFLTYTDEATSFLAAVNSGYFCTGTLTATLPGSPTQGQTVVIAVDSSDIAIIQANTGQTIRLGNETSSSGGTATNTFPGDSMMLVYRAANAEWFSLSTEGSWILN